MPREQNGAAAVVVVAGVSGSGKSTIAALLAGRLGWPFMDGDLLQPPWNIAKMSSGVPLTDSDRLPWLQDVVRWMDGQIQDGQSAVVVCSAIKRSYRDMLTEQRPSVRIAFLEIDMDICAQRLAARQGHFFDPRLLGSQFAELEPPGPDEPAVMTFRVTGGAEEIADEITRAFRLGEHV